MKKITRNFILLAILAAVFVFSAVAAFGEAESGTEASGSEAGIREEVVSVTLNEHELSMQPGETFLLTADPDPKNTEYSLFYQVDLSDDYYGLANAAATVDPDTGLVTAHSLTAERTVNPVKISVYLAAEDAEPVRMDTCTVTVAEPEAWNGAVADFRAEPEGPNTVRLSWTAADGADGYLLLKNGVQFAYTAKETSVYDREASSEEFNFYWVLPYQQKGNVTVKGTLSGYVWAIGRKIAPVKEVITTGKADGIELSWPAADGANEYVILSKTGSPKAAFDRPASASRLTWTDSGAKPGEVRFYWVYGVYRDAEGRIIAAGGVSSYAWGIRTTE